MLPEELKIEIENKIGTISSVNSIAGGSINSSVKIEAKEVTIFFKSNSKNKYAEMFKKESLGLELLSSGPIRVPKTLFLLETENYSGIALEFIVSGSQNNHMQSDFGQKLAELHQINGSNFGLNHSNYMGSLVQSNNFHDSFKSFFIKERLIPQIKLARDQGYLSPSDEKKFNSLYNKLDTLLPIEKPSLVHGDLWSGNYMADENNSPVLIDPAVAYSHREVDMAMTTLFRGFSQYFYDAYQETFSMEPGFKNRFDIYNLYPLLVHLNLFGSSYYRQCMSILSIYK